MVSDLKSAVIIKEVRVASDSVGETKDKCDI